MRMAAAAAAPLLAVGTCGAFIPVPGSCRTTAQSSQRAHPWLKSSRSDSVDAIPSDVAPEYDATRRASPEVVSTSASDFSLASDLLLTISSGIGEGYIPYSETDKRDLSKLDGRWRLAFTNNLVGLGKFSPLELKDVYQVIDSSSGLLTNIAYAVVSPPLFAETWGRLGQRAADLAKTVEGQVTFPVDFNIQHTFNVASQYKPAQIELIQKELKLLNVEDERKRSLVLPTLQPFAKAAAGRFDTTFVNDDVRISRGRFGEMRVFVRED